MHAQSAVVVDVASVMGRDTEATGKVVVVVSLVASAITEGVEPTRLM
jgi:hypothetical protein